VAELPRTPLGRGSEKPSPIHLLKGADYGATRRVVAGEQDGGVSFPGVGPPDESRIVDALRGLDEDDAPKQGAESRLCP